MQTMPLKLAKGRGTAATCVAVVFAACRLERLPRTFKEILAIVPEADQKKVCLPITDHDLCPQPLAPMRPVCCTSHTESGSS